MPKTTTESETTQPKAQTAETPIPEQSQENDRILCPHCRRTASNGIKCKGICVADNDY